MMFQPGDKVMRVGSIPGGTHGVIRNWPHGSPAFGRVYCVLECWKTSRGYQLWLAGFGLGPPIYNGYKTGWAAKHFRKIEHIRQSEELKVLARVGQGVGV